MARVYDIISRIEAGNEKPIVKIDAEHEYKVNNSKAAVMRLNVMAEDEKMSEEERLDSIIKVALGKEAFEYIESLDLSMVSYNSIISAIMAAVGDISIEELEEELNKNKDKKKTPRK